MLNFTQALYLITWRLKKIVKILCGKGTTIIVPTF
jgi:hypothetical protein